jgi:5-(carboxyamino)imidazole ribonucleotide mutase
MLLVACNNSEVVTLISQFPISFECETVMAGKAVIIMGSERDLDFSREIAKYLKLLSVNYEFRVASAHKTPEKVLEIIKEFENEKIVYVTVAGRSNALSAFIDGNTVKPVIACPPYSDRFSGADIYSSLRVPSGIGSVVTIEPEGAAIAAAKILSLQDAELETNVKTHQEHKKKELDKANESVKNLK